MVLTMNTAAKLMDAETRVMEGQSWRDFCRALEAAGDLVLARTTPAAPIDRAEGYRYLTRLTRIGLEMMLEHADPDFPTFYAASHPTAKIGGDNPDNLYQNATDRGRPGVPDLTAGATPCRTSPSAPRRTATRPRARWPRPASSRRRT